MQDDNDNSQDAFQALPPDLDAAFRQLQSIQAMTREEFDEMVERGALARYLTHNGIAVPTSLGALYDGQDDSVLPERMKQMLTLLPARSAARLRDWMTNYPVSEIDRQTDYILGDEYGSPFRPPINPSHVAQQQATEQKAAEVAANQPNPWDLAKESVDRFAELYKTLAAAGMSEQGAIAVIDTMLSEARSEVVGVPIRIQTAGARVARVERSPNVFDSDGMPVYGSGRTRPLHPLAGWPPVPIGGNGL